MKTVSTTATRTDFIDLASSTEAAAALPSITTASSAASPPTTTGPTATLATATTRRHPTAIALPIAAAATATSTASAEAKVSTRTRDSAARTHATTAGPHSASATTEPTKAAASAAAPTAESVVELHRHAHRQTCLGHGQRIAALVAALVIALGAEHFLNGNQAILVGVQLEKVVIRPAALPPLIERNLAILIAIELGKPVGKLTREIACMVNDVFLLFLRLDRDHARALWAVTTASAEWIVPPAPLRGVRHGLGGTARLVILLVLSQIDETILVLVPDLQFGLERIGHFISIKQAIAIAVEILETPGCLSLQVGFRQRRSTRPGHATTRQTTWAAAATPETAGHHLLHIACKLVASDLAVGDALILEELGHSISKSGVQSIDLDHVCAARKGIEHHVRIQVESTHASTRPARATAKAASRAATAVPPTSASKSLLHATAKPVLRRLLRCTHVRGLCIPRSLELVSKAWLHSTRAITTPVPATALLLGLSFSRRQRDRQNQGCCSQGENALPASYLHHE